MNPQIGFARTRCRTSEFRKHRRLSGTKSPYSRSELGRLSLKRGREKTLLVGPCGRPSLRLLPRRGVGGSFARQPTSFRAALSRRSAGGTVVVDDSQKERGIYEGLRGVRCCRGGSIR